MFMLLLCVCCRTDCVFSPSDQLVVTGVSVKKGEGSGQIIFFDRNTLERVSSVDASDDSVRIHLVLFNIPTFNTRGLFH